MEVIWFLDFLEGKLRPRVEKGLTQGPRASGKTDDFQLILELLCPRGYPT